MSVQTKSILTERTLFYWKISQILISQRKKT